MTDQPTLKLQLVTDDEAARIQRAQADHERHMRDDTDWRARRCPCAVVPVERVKRADDRPAPEEDV